LTWWDPSFHEIFAGLLGLLVLVHHSVWHLLAFLFVAQFVGPAGLLDLLPQVGAESLAFSRVPSGAQLGGGHWL
jgi:hypothetical protein